jgi:dTDP-glucose 4,6-dehydratase
VPRALLAGGAGFLGSHLCDRLVAEGWEIICVDSLITGDAVNVEAMQSHQRFQFERHDITEPMEIRGPLDWVLNLASPASPTDYQEFPVDTLRVGAVGTLQLLQLSKSKGASFLLASTSEVYGDPHVHPQPESYWGHVNPIGPRSVYDEGKRYAEAATMAYHWAYGLPIRIVRIFNTYGPRMRARDGRAVPTFVQQAIAGEPLTVHGDGSQTRSLCFVDDTIEGIVRLIRSEHIGPVNIGNPQEITVLELAETIRDIVHSSSEIVMVDRPVDDPERRRPDISLARQVLGWEPEIPLNDGLHRTVDWAMTAWRQAPSSGPV